MKIREYLIGAACALVAILIIGAASVPGPDVSPMRMIYPPFDLGATTNIDGRSGFLFYRGTTNTALALQLTNLISGASYEIQIFNIGGTAAKITLTGSTGTTLSAANVTAAQSLDFGTPTANTCSRILITVNGNTNRVDFMDNYK